MEQATAFLEESEILASLIEERGLDHLDKPTQFKGWSVEDVLVHLHFWNRAADQSLTDPDGFKALIADLVPKIPTMGLRAIENDIISERGQDIFFAWRELFRDMGKHWSAVDPKTRLDWVGPTMSARSSITARQMETWAHGHEVFDLLGAVREESDRIKNIVILGVNTFGFSYQIRGKAIPEAMPRLKLTAPSGALWEFGDHEDLIEGSALGFAQTVTQTRNVADTDLVVTGDLAQEWMNNAQCFAGGVESPPPPGSRLVQQGV